MNSSFVIILLSFAILIAYVVYSLVTLKVMPESLSETYYRLNYKKKGLGRLFPITMFICAATLLPIWLDYSKDNFQWLVFLACSATLFVAVTPNYYEGLERQVHYGAAVVCYIMDYVIGNMVHTDNKFRISSWLHGYVQSEETNSIPNRNSHFIFSIYIPAIAIN